MKPVEAFSQHLPIPIYLALWESSDIIWCSMPPGLNPRSLRPDPGQLPIGSNLDNVTSERMRGMYVTHDKRYSKDWTYFIKNGETWSNTKYDEIVKIFTHNHTEHIQHTFEQRSTYLWSPVHHTCRPIEAWIDCLKGAVVLVSKHYQHTVAGDLELLGIPAWKALERKLAQPLPYKKVLRGSTPTDHVTTETLVESLEEQTGQCTWWKLVIKASMWRCVETNLRPHLCW